HRLRDVYWEYTDPESGIAYFDTGMVLNTSFLNTGIFVIKAAAVYCDGIMQLTDTVNVLALPEPIMADTMLCPERSLIVYAPNDNTTVMSWSDGSSADSVRINSSGWWWLERSNMCGSFVDSFYVTENFRPI